MSDTDNKVVQKVYTHLTEFRDPVTATPELLDQQQKIIEMHQQEIESGKKILSSVLGNLEEVTRRERESKDAVERTFRLLAQVGAPTNPAVEMQNEWLRLYHELVKVMANDLPNHEVVQVNAARDILTNMMQLDLEKQRFLESQTLSIDYAVSKMSELFSDFSATEFGIAADVYRQSVPLEVQAETLRHVANFFSHCAKQGLGLKKDVTVEDFKKLVDVVKNIEFVSGKAQYSVKPNNGET